MTEPDRIKQLQLYYLEHGVLPSYSTIATLIGFKSKNSVFEFIDRMKLYDRIALTPENKIKPGKRFWVSCLLVDESEKIV